MKWVSKGKGSFKKTLRGLSWKKKLKSYGNFVCQLRRKD